jgi:hypothetical protein
MTTLKEFLSNLAQDPKSLGEFIIDPDGSMSAAEVSEQDKQAIRSGFTNIIYARLSGVSVDEAFESLEKPLPTQ